MGKTTFGRPAHADKALPTNEMKISSGKRGAKTKKPDWASEFLGALVLREGRAKMCLLRLTLY